MLFTSTASVYEECTQHKGPCTKGSVQQDHTQFSNLSQKRRRRIFIKISEQMPLHQWYKLVVLDQVFVVFMQQDLKFPNSPYHNTYFLGCLILKELYITQYKYVHKLYISNFGCIQLAYIEYWMASMAVFDGKKSLTATSLFSFFLSVQFVRKNYSISLYMH